MKNTNTCPKCSSTKVFMIPGRVANAGDNFIPAGIFHNVRVDRYLCEDCGFSEEWITDKQDIQALKKKYSNKP